MVRWQLVAQKSKSLNSQPFVKPNFSTFHHSTISFSSSRWPWVKKKTSTGSFFLPNLFWGTGCFDSPLLGLPTLLDPHARSVCVFSLLWAIITYAFAIILRQLTEGSSIGDAFFKSVPVPWLIGGVQKGLGMLWDVQTFSLCGVMCMHSFTLYFTIIYKFRSIV